MALSILEQRAISKRIKANLETLNAGGLSAVGSTSVKALPCESVAAWFFMAKPIFEQTRAKLE